MSTGRGRTALTTSVFRLTLLIGVITLAVALIVTPWLAFKLLGSAHGHDQGEEYALEKTWIYRNYEKVMRPLLARPRQMVMALTAVGVLLVGAAGMFVTRWVQVKMLPFDDKNEVQVIIDMPEGTPLEATVALASDVGRAVGAVSEVADVQLYAGVGAPFNFNGMIRHYYLRQGAHVADLLGLARKGYLHPGRDADIVILTPSGEVDRVYARGRLLVDRGTPLVRGPFGAAPFA